LRLFSFGGYGLALAALALVVFGTYDSYPLLLQKSYSVLCFVSGKLLDSSSRWNSNTKVDQQHGAGNPILHEVGLSGSADHPVSENTSRNSSLTFFEKMLNIPPIFRSLLDAAYGHSISK